MSPCATSDLEVAGLQQHVENARETIRGCRNILICMTICEALPRSGDGWTGY
jgi:hypothetical protein